MSRRWLEQLEREGYLKDESLDGEMVVRIELKHGPSLLGYCSVSVLRFLFYEFELPELPSSVETE
jgi:hypothetical protein